MGLIAYVYKHEGYNGDTPNKLCLTNVEGPFEPSNEYPAAKLVPGNLKGTVKVTLDAHEGKWTMFDGCYVATSDSRFGEAVERLLGHRFYGAVPLHNRVE